MTAMRAGIIAAAMVALAVLMSGAALAQRALSNGQHLYLPIYAVIQYGDRDRSGAARELPVSSLVSIHNTDLERPIRLVAARYFATDGKFLRNFITTPSFTAPLSGVRVP